MLEKHKIVIEWTRYKTKIPWTEVGIVEVEGTSLENAIANAEENIDNLILPMGEYIDESFKIDKTTTRILSCQKENLYA